MSIYPCVNCVLESSVLDGGTCSYKLKSATTAKTLALFSIKKITASCLPQKALPITAEIKVAYKLSSLIPCRPHTLYK